MRLVTSMGAAVDSQGAALDERFVAGFVVAGIGAFIGMYSIMALEVGLPIETLRDVIAISLWWVWWDVKKQNRIGACGAGWFYLWATLMPFALKRASGHIGSKGTRFDSWTLLRSCFIHHGWRIARGMLLSDVSRKLLGRG